jgi:hypothetical protein
MWERLCHNTLPPAPARASGERRVDQNLFENCSREDPGFCLNCPENIDLVRLRLSLSHRKCAPYYRNYETSYINCFASRRAFLCRNSFWLNRSRRKRASSALASAFELSQFWIVFQNASINCLSYVERHPDEFLNCLLVRDSV